MYIIAADGESTTRPIGLAIHVAAEGPAGSPCWICGAGDSERWAFSRFDPRLLCRDGEACVERWFASAATVSLHEAAGSWGFNYNTVRGLAVAGRIPAHKGRTGEWRVSKAAVEEGLK